MKEKLEIFDKIQENILSVNSLRKWFLKGNDKSKS